MTKLIIQHLWSDFKKHWLGILVTLVLCYIATIFENSTSDLPEKIGRAHV